MKSPLDKPFDKPFKKPDGKAQRVRVVNTPGKTTLIIPSASKIDAGIYTLTLTSEEGSASVDISVKVIGKSIVLSSPHSKLKFLTLTLRQTWSTWYSCYF